MGRFSLYQDLTVEENLIHAFGTTVKRTTTPSRPSIHRLNRSGKRRAGSTLGGMKQKRHSAAHWSTSRVRPVPDERQQVSTRQP